MTAPLKNYTPRWVNSKLIKTVVSLGGCTYHICEVKTNFLAMSTGLMVSDDKGNYFMDITREKMDWMISEGFWIENKKD